MKKKALIIGASGFVGVYLIKELNAKGWKVFATKLEDENINLLKDNIINLDVLNYNEVVDVLKKIKPNYVFHLAAQSSVAYSWKNPKKTVDININGTINILEGIKAIVPSSKILLIGSSEQYGDCKTTTGIIDENHAILPNNIYAMTKASQEMIGRIYAKAYSLNICMVRAFNHIGPGQSSQFVVSDFCKQVAEIEKKIKSPIIKVGNLETSRDFTDVRDIVSAYSKLIENGVPGEIYNVGSSKAVKIKDILNLIIENSEIPINVEIDPNKVRPIDTPLIKANINKLKNIIEWTPKYTIENTILEILKYWREKIGGENEYNKRNI